MSGTLTSQAEGISPCPLQVGQVEPSVQMPRPRQFGHFLALKTFAISYTRMRETGPQLWISKIPPIRTNQLAFEVGRCRNDRRRDELRLAHGECDREIRSG